MKRLAFGLLFISIFILSTSSAQAEPVYSAHVTADLVSQVDEIQAGNSFWVALNLKMDPHWHTYWKNAGDSGLATQIQWTLPEGVEVSEISWPAPQRIVLETLGTYAYEGEASLLIKVSTSESLPSDSNLLLKATSHWLACEKICIPGQGSWELSIPASNSETVLSQKNKDLFDRAFAALPKKESSWESEIYIEKNEILLKLTPDVEALKDAYFFPYRNDIIDHVTDPVLLQEDNEYWLRMKKSSIFPEELHNVEGVLKHSRGSVQLNSEVSSNQAVDLPSLAEGYSLMTILLFAFLGGLILNLMPCVLPVLSLKIMSFIDHAKESRLDILKQGTSFSLGVLSAFWVLAGILISLKAGGEQIGWGFQLQSSGFLIFLTVLFFLLTLNLFGMFEIGLTLTTISPAQKKETFVHAFFNGVLATIVATPCTAPFMGTALGFALTQTTLVTFFIFSALGLGMAFPYLLLSIFPAWLKHVPKPGPWMLQFKKFLALLLLGTVTWLLWVLYQQINHEWFLPVMIACLLSLLTAVWLYGLKQQGGANHRKSFYNSLSIGFLILGIGIAFSANHLPQGHSLPNKHIKSGIPWINYSPDILEDYLQEEIPVFVDFTAAWCLTCQVNERIALSHPDVIQKFKDLNVVALKADWTSRDPVITKALKEYGRQSIPLYVLYPPESPEEPILLPEILTPKIVMNALQKHLVNEKENSNV